MLSVKTKEHIRRRVLRTCPKFGVLFAGVTALGLTLALTGSLLRVVTITDSHGQNGRVITAAQNMEVLFRQAGVTPEGAQDEMIVTEQTGADTFHILRAYTVPVTADGQTQNVLLTGGTVAQALEKAGVALGANDLVSPAADQPAGEGTAITVQRVAYKDYTLQESIPVETLYRYSSLYYRDQDFTQTLQTGTEGLTEVSYRDTYVDGVKTEQVETGRSVLTEMIPTIVKCYQAGAPVSYFQGPAIEDGKPAEGIASSFIGQRATGYAASATAKGASGRRLTYGTVAINPGQIPYGSLMYITSADGTFVYGYAYAADTGTAMMNGTAFIDLYYETRDESIRNAVIPVNVYVLDAATAAQYKETNDALLKADTVAGR